MSIAHTAKASIWWNSTGTGSPILLINGLSSPSSVWFRIVPILAESHRVIVFDNIGTGRSSTPGEAWDLRDMADAAAAVLEAARATNSAVLGMSVGGLIAEELTLNHPELVSQLILVSSHAGLAHLSPDPDVLAALNDSAALSADERTELLMGFTYAAATPKEKWHEDAAVRAEIPTTQEGYAGQLAAANPWDRLGELHTIQVPTLILHGIEDQMVPLASAQLVARTIPNARMTVLPSAGHQLFTDQTDAGTRAVLDFIHGDPA